MFNYDKKGATLIIDISAPFVLQSMPQLSSFDWIKNIVFEGHTIIANKSFSHWYNLNSVKGKIVPFIGDDAFRNCKKLEKVDFSDNIEEIGKSAFEGCKELTKVKLSHKIKRIGAYAFEGCKNLLTLSLPEDVTLEENAVPSWTEIIYI